MTKSITRGNEEQYLAREAIYQEDITIVTMYISNNRVLICMTQKLSEKKNRQIHNYGLIVNIPFSVTDWTSRQICI